MSTSLINPNDSTERQAEKLLQITEVLMRRVEQSTDESGVAYAHFQRAVLLEEQVRDRTRDLEQALDLLNDLNERLGHANRETEAARQNLANAIETIQEGFALFDSNNVLVMCNSRFGMHMVDIRDILRPGLRFETYVERISRSAYLALPDTESPEQWQQLRMARHLDRHVIFNVRLIGDRWVQVSEHRTMDGGTVILQTDVTDMMRMERHEREKLLDDQARVIRATLDHINQGVCIFDRSLRLVGWNQRLVSLLAISIQRFQIGASFDNVLQRFQEEMVLDNGISLDAVAAWVHSKSERPALRFEARRGSIILDVFAQEMPDLGFVMSFTDVTAERQAISAMYDANETLEQRVTERTLELQDALGDAERANASRTRFVAAASHDLLQPLSAAKLFIASIADESVSQKTRGTLEKAQNALVSVESILDALLDISKLESGQAAVDVTLLRLDQLLGQLRDEFGPLATQKGLVLRIVPCSVVVSSDASYLRRILQNLIANAVRYTATGKVLVGVRRLGDRVRVEVWDTGPGIPEHEQINVFKEFHRLNARASASEGMGLGLAIVERACALLDHALGLQSVPGRGTRFSVTLPLVKGQIAQAGMVPMRDKPSVAGTQNKIVLLVENDLDLRRAMCLLLEKWGISVLDVKDGEEAVALLDEIGIVPDTMLVDFQLGDGMTGVDLIRKLHAQYGPVPARIITADRSIEIQALCKRYRIEIMHKPIDAGTLEAYLHVPSAQ